MKREVPLLLTFLFGAFAVLSNFIVWQPWRTAAESVNNWALIVIAFTTVLGVGNVLRLHGVKISRRESGWAYSAATLLGLIVMVVFGIVLWYLPQREGSTTVLFRALKDVPFADALNVSAPTGSGDLFDVRVAPALAKDQNRDGKAQAGDEIEYRIEYGYAGAEALTSAVFPIRFDPAALELLSPKLAAGSPLHAAPEGLVWDAGRIEASAFGVAGAGNGQMSVYTWFYDAVYVPMQSTMYALLAFFISSAAFRAFRVRSTHAVLLGVTALVVILGSVPVGEAVWGRFPDLVGWVMSDLQTAGKRAILIGAALGAIATGMKMIVGAERSYLSGD